MKNPKTPQQMMTEMVRTLGWSVSNLHALNNILCAYDADDEAGYECNGRWKTGVRSFSSI